MRTLVDVELDSSPCGRDLLPDGQQVEPGVRMGRAQPTFISRTHHGKPATVTRRGKMTSVSVGLPEEPPLAVSVRGLVKRYDAVEAVRGVDFDVAPGEVFGFLGPNGAGKSTTINVLCTLIKPTAGTALVAGYDVARQRDQVRRNIGLVFQDTTLDSYLTAEQNLRFHAELYGVPRAGLPDRMRQVLEMVGLWERRGSVVMTFSGGMKRRLEIARGLMHSPRVLFLDEPTVGPGPADPRLDLGLHPGAQARRGHHDLPDDALHGRGRVLRPHRDHGRRPDRRDRHS